jgi:arylsulfatase A-like enzyme
MTRKRMETADEEFLSASLDFVRQAVKNDRPFFVWLNTTRMHVWTRLKPSARGVTGVGLYPDGMVEHDGHVGQMLTLLDELKIADNTVVIYSTDNGAETVSWPDGGITPFHGEKGTTWEGGMRVPALVRWPGVVEPGSRINQIMAHEDWMPTLLAAVGEPKLVEMLKRGGYRANGKEWQVHLDGYNFLPYFKGEVDQGPRESVLYFGQNGELNAVRWRKFKVNFAGIQGDLITGVRQATNWPLVVDLLADPYERMPFESGMYFRWMADHLWLFVPIAGQVKGFFATLADYPFQAGSGLNMSNVDYMTLKMTRALEMLDALPNRPAPGER